MKIAFLISAHTDAPQLHRLIKALPDESEFFVHIDKKADITPFKQLMGNDNRVHFIEHRVDVVWGSLNEVEYQMELVRAALNAPQHFDRLITLSGMDYPLWSKEEIRNFFTDNPDKEFLCGLDMTTQTKAARLYREYRFLAMRHWKNGSIGSKFRVAIRKAVSVIGIRKPLSFHANSVRYRLYKGAAWWAISQDLATHILHEWDHNQEMKSYFSTSFCPAETFVQTVTFNSSEWKGRCIELKGEWPGLQALTPLTYIYYHPVIKIMEEEDYDKLMQSGKMFARKFVSGKSDELIHMISRRYGQK